MDIEMFRHYCLSLPGTTEDVKWEENLCFLIENKIYVIYSLTKGSFAIKCDVEEFQELVSRDGINQAYHTATGRQIYHTIIRLNALCVVIKKVKNNHLKSYQTNEIY